jgi:integrase
VARLAKRRQRFVAVTLLKKLDCAALGHVLVTGRQTRCRRELAEIDAAIQGQLSKNQEHHERLFNHARRHEWTDRNPITLVRQSAKRERLPEVLTDEELQALIPHLSVRDRVLVLLDACTGLRVGELLGLKWSDVDFENGQLHVTRSVVDQVVGDCRFAFPYRTLPNPCRRERRL